jgi:hypothetical protein
MGKRRTFGVVFVCTSAEDISDDSDAFRGTVRRGIGQGCSVTQDNARILREKKTIKAMVRIACRGRHGPRDGLCPGCSQLLDYALERLEKCPFQEGKTTCADCPVHCYRPVMREEIRAVMRYAGPRMMLRHPILAVCHVIDGLRNHPNESADAGERQEA